jgi:hypothetical protein
VEENLELGEPGERVAGRVEVLQPRERRDALDARDGVVREQQRLERRQWLASVVLSVAAIVQSEQSVGGREAVVREVEHAQEAQAGKPGGVGQLVARQPQLEQERVRAREPGRQPRHAVARQVGAAHQRADPARAALPLVRARAPGHVVVCSEA